MCRKITLYSLVTSFLLTSCGGIGRFEGRWQDPDDAKRTMHIEKVTEDRFTITTYYGTEIASRCTGLAIGKENNWLRAEGDKCRLEAEDLYMKEGDLVFNNEHWTKLE